MENTSGEGFIRGEKSQKSTLFSMPENSSVFRTPIKWQRVFFVGDRKLPKIQQKWANNT